MAEIEGIKLIRHNRRRIDNPDDPSYPYKLTVIFRPERDLDAGIERMMGGREELVVCGKTAEALVEFVQRNGYLKNPRKLKLTLTGPRGNITL